MPSLLGWQLTIGLTFIGFGLLGCSSLAVQRRPHFWIRLSLVCLGMVTAVVVLYGAIELELLPSSLVMLVWLTVVVSGLVLAPVACYRRAGAPPGPTDDDGGERTHPLPPIGPHGGVPLMDAEQSRSRRRDHTPTKLCHPRPRRPAREPTRVPSRPRP